MTGNGAERQRQGLEDQRKSLSRDFLSPSRPYNTPSGVLGAGLNLKSVKQMPRHTQVVPPSCGTMTDRRPTTHAVSTVLAQEVSQVCPLVPGMHWSREVREGKPEVA